MWAPQRGCVVSILTCGLRGSRGMRLAYPTVGVVVVVDALVVRAAYVVVVAVFTTHGAIVERHRETRLRLRLRVVCDGNTMEKGKTRGRGLS